MLVNGYDDYDIQIDGTITNLKRNRKLKHTINSNGYIVVTLCNGSKYKQFYLHRLLADHFIPRVEGKNWVDHIDMNKSNNNIENLRWCDVYENNINRNANKSNKLNEKNIFSTDKVFVVFIRGKGKRVQKTFSKRKYSLDYVKIKRDEIVSSFHEQCGN